MTKGDLLFISWYSRPRPGGTAVIMDRYWRALETGTFRVITESTPPWPDGEPPDWWRNRIEVPTAGATLVAQAVMLWRVFKTVLRAIRTARPREAWIVYPDPIFCAGAFLACKLKRVPFTVYMHDTWSAAVRHRRWAHRVLARLERPMLRKARRVFAISEALASYCEPIADKPVAVLPHPAVPAADSFDRPFPESGPWTLAFTGAIYDMNRDSVALAVRAAARIPQLRVVLCTPMTTETLAAYDPALAQAERCHFPSDAAYSGFMEQVDILVSGIACQSGLNEDERFTALPTKTFDYCRWGRPILVVAPEKSATAAHARRHGYALVVDQPDESLIEAALRRILADAELRAALARGQRELLRGRTAHDGAAVMESTAGLP